MKHLCITTINGGRSMNWNQSHNVNHHGYTNTVHDGDKYYSLPKEQFDLKWGISRQRKAEAIDKLEKEGLIATVRKKGCSTKVRLILK